MERIKYYGLAKEKLRRGVILHLDGLMWLDFTVGSFEEISIYDGLFH